MAFDYHKEILALKDQLRKEIDSKRILEDWIKSSLKTTLETHQAELKRISVTYESKILSLEQRLEKEVVARKKLTQWVKDNLGPTLEALPFKEAVATISAAKTRRDRSGSESASSSSTLAPNASSKKPASLKMKKSAAAGAATRKRRGSTEDGDDSPWSDESDHESTYAPSSKASQAGAQRSGSHTGPSKGNVAGSSFSAASSSSNAHKQGAQSLQSMMEGTSIHGSALASAKSPPAPNPALKSRIQKLAVLEQWQWGSDDVTNYEFPTGDAIFKTNKARMEYYLHEQKQASINYSTPMLLDRASMFVQKGGRIVFAPLLQVDMLKDSFNFAIATNDRLFPVCPDGLLRSQIMYLVLQGIKRKLGVSAGLELPHGARRGFDPFVLSDHETDIQLQYSHLAAPSSGKDLPVFQAAFGVDKAPRFGQEVCGNHPLSLPTTGKSSKHSELELNEIAKHRNRMREYFDIFFYGSFKSAGSSGTASSASSASSASYVTGGGRIIFIVFGSAVPIVIERLTEVNYRFDLTKVTILALPYSSDRLASTDSKPEDYVAAWKLYASLFTPILEGPL